MSGRVTPSGYTVAGIPAWERAMRFVRHRLPALPSLAGDTALTASAALFAVANVLRRDRGPGLGAMPAWAVFLAVLSALALLPRGRWPVGALVAVGLLGAIYLLATGSPLFSILPTVFIALYSAVAYSSRPRMSVWAVALGVCVALNGINLLGSEPGRPLIDVFGIDAGPPGPRDHGPLPPPPQVRDSGIPERVSTLLFDSAWLMTALLLGEAMRGRRAVAQEAELRVVQAERAQQEAERAQQEMAQRRVVEERLQIARELHDVLAHTIAVINIQAGVAAHVIDKQPEQAREALTTIKTASRTTLQELRALVGVLRETDAAAPRVPTSGLAALGDLIDTVRDAGLTVEVDLARPRAPLPATVDVAAYRILQEALTNVIKHVGPAPVHITVSQDAERLELEVTNGRNGRSGAPHGEGSGHGIIGMRERAAALGGALQAGPLPDGGFRVHAVLPLPGGVS